MDRKSYDNGSDFSFVEQKVREVQTTIENAVKTSNYQELNQSITRMVNSTLKQYQKEHPEKAGYRKPEAGAQKVPTSFLKKFVLYWKKYASQEVRHDQGGTEGKSQRPAPAAGGLSDDG